MGWLALLILAKGQCESLTSGIGAEKQTPTSFLFPNLNVSINAELGSQKAMMLWPTMTLRELKKIIVIALRESQKIIDEQPKVVLSEADLERLVSWCIMNELGLKDYKKPDSSDFSVHTQISHYTDGEIKPNKRPDILLLTEKGMKNATKRKGFEYRDSSFTIELKYLHSDDSVERVNEDFEKRKELYNMTWQYVVVLIESENDESYKHKAKLIRDKKNKFIIDNPQYKNKLFHFTLHRKKVEFTIPHD